MTRNLDVDVLNYEKILEEFICGKGLPLAKLVYCPIEKFVEEINKFLKEKGYQELSIEEHEQLLNIILPKYGGRIVVYYNPFLRRMVKSVNVGALGYAYCPDKVLSL